MDNPQTFEGWWATVPYSSVPMASESLAAAAFAAGVASQQAITEMNRETDRLIHLGDRAEIERTGENYHVLGMKYNALKARYEAVVEAARRVDSWGWGEAAPAECATDFLNLRAALDALDGK